MANIIKFKRGAAASIPTLNDGEPGWTTDTFRLFIGQGGANKLVGEADFVKLSGSTMTGLLTLSGDPSANLHAATKQYVDNLVQGIDAKASVRAATTGNITLSGTQTIDGVVLSVGERVLVKSQTAPAENGIYLVAAGAWARAADADSWNELVSLYVWVEGGTANGDSGWLCTVEPGGTLGVTAVTFVQFSGAGQITAGAGLTKTGNQIDVGGGDGMVINADGIQTNIDTAAGLKYDASTPKKMQVSLDAAGALEFNAGAVRVKLDGSTLTRAAAGLKITAGGVTATELNTSVAGNGLTGGGGTALAVGAGTLITVGADSVGLSNGTAQYQVPVTGATPFTPSYTLLSTFAGDGLGFSGGAFVVNVGNGIQIVTDTVQPTYGTTANTVCQGNDSRLHTQNTDTGTNQTNFQIGSGGPKLNNGGASLLRIRSATDQADVVVDARAIRFQIQGASYYHTIQPTSAPGSNIVFDLPATGTTLLGDNSTIDGGTF